MCTCLTQELAERYAAGECSGDERQIIEAHLAECETCRRQTTSFGATEKPNSKISSRHDLPKSIPSETARPIEKTRVLPDELPTKSIAEPMVPTLDQHDLTQSPGHTHPRAGGSMIEGYEIIEEMPRGGQAVVYKAVHTATKTHVAIKVLLPTLLASARARHYFEREAELIASLDHPNIVGIRDSGIIHHQYYFVMQYIDGQTLEKYVRSENLSFRGKVLLFYKICTAITYAHQQGVMHRDLKFANILVDQRGEPHVLDFGLAKAVGLGEKAPDRAVVTMTGQLAGTLSTMSPEQAAGRPDLIDVRTDVYSLGVILYCMLTGQYPYDVTGSTLEVLQNIQKAEPVRPRQIIRKFDSDIEAILLTALAKDPDQRYHSAADLKSDIEHWLEGRPIRVKCVSTTYLLRKIITRHRYTSTVAALLLLIVMAFAYVSFDLYLTAKKAQRQSEQKANSLSAQIATTNEVTRLFAFTQFLESWRLNLDKKAVSALSYMSRDSKEQKAALFLFDPAPVADKADNFRQAFSGEHRWFAEFIIGENHLRNGDRNKAKEAFKRSYDAIPRAPQGSTKTPSVDNWLFGQIRGRLHELNAIDSPTTEDKKS